MLVIGQLLFASSSDAFSITSLESQKLMYALTRILCEWGPLPQFELLEAAR